MSFTVAPIRPNSQAISYDDLLRRGSPSSTTQPEAFRDVIYDTQDVTTTTTVLNFFQTLQTDRTLGNLAQAGALPAAQFFAIAAISCELLVIPAAGAAAGGVGVSDPALVFITERPIFTLTVSDKPYGPFPLVYAGSAGGLSMSGYGSTTADTNSAGLAQNSGNGGYFLGNTVLLMPNVQFGGTVQFAAAPSSLSVTRKLRITLHGTRYRRVV